MKLGARALLLFWMSFFAGLGLVGYAIYAGERSVAFPALALFIFSAFLLVVYRVFASSAHCPLCHGRVLSGTGAQRSRRARRTFGSHRLRVARDIVLTNTFVCPYCNESTLCIVKDRPRRGRAVRRRFADRK